MENQELKYAGFVERFIALFIDLIVFLCLYSIMKVFILKVIPSVDIMENLVPSIQTEIYTFDFFYNYFAFLLRSFILFIIFFIFLIFYEIFLVGKFGATLGKMIMGIKIVDENGNKISYGTAFIREILIKVVFYFLIFFIAGLGYLWALWDKKKQTWHDKIAKTIVIKE
ncbi:MAG: RDD family protein [bacterium]|nr:RDD family protein [bacterium]MDW8163721.1 RDD family protein [Candidatus Omnitrophota bacterium]